MPFSRSATRTLRTNGDALAPCNTLISVSPLTVGGGRNHSADRPGRRVELEELGDDVANTRRGARPLADPHARRAQRLAAFRRAERHADQIESFALEHQRRRLGRTVGYARPVGAAAGVQGDELVAATHAELDRLRRCTRAARVQAEAEAQAIGIELLTGADRQQELRAPFGQRHEHRSQAEPGLGQLIDDRGGRWRQTRLRYQAAFLEKRETLAENARADAAQPAAQITEALRPDQQLANDEDGPALADNLRRTRDGTELGIAKLRHASSMPDRSTKIKLFSSRIVSQRWVQCRAGGSVRGRRGWIRPGGYAGGPRAARRCAYRW